MKAIVAVDSENGIGLNGKLLVSIPEDMRFFKNTTTGKTIVMGRKTLESFPNKKPLPNRRNIVLTTDKNYQADGVEVVHSKEEAVSLLNGEEDVFVIGGESIYNLFMDEIDTIYLTRIEKKFESDKYFPNFLEDDQWELVSESERKYFNDVSYKFCLYSKSEYNED